MLQKHEPLVAYYCRLYAMERGLKIPAKERTETTSALLVSLMKQLEKDKKSLTLGPEDNLYLEGFASNVFAKADKQDRAGRADLTTAKTFYAASIFFEILSQFGEVQPEIEQKQKYAIWKAADIRKAIKEGRRPEPGPPGGDQDLSGPMDSSWEGNSPPGQLRQENSQASLKASARSMPDEGTKPEPSSQFLRNLQHYSADKMEPPASFSGPDYQGVGSHSQAPQDFSQSHPAVHCSSYYSVQGRPQDAPGGQLGAGIPIQFAYNSVAGINAAYVESTPLEHATSVPTFAPAAAYFYDSSYQPPPAKIAEAHKAARFAVGALAFDDVPTAVDHLKRSLELLTLPSISQ
ncbi:hypothetical protein SUGI_0880580 [Cryptomeria japonica]|nr:hypothetical protein SUGI_0880580 [Cryptomeria japonica]